MAEQIAGILREIVAAQTGKPQGAESTVFNGENLGADLTKPCPESIPSLKINPLDPAAQMILSAFTAPDVMAAMQAAVKAFPKSIEARLQMARLLITQNGSGSPPASPQSPSLQRANDLITQNGVGNNPPAGLGPRKWHPVALTSSWEKTLASIEEEDPFEWRVAWTRGAGGFLP